MNSLASIAFGVTGDFDPANLTKDVSLIPYRVYSKGSKSLPSRSSVIYYCKRCDNQVTHQGEVYKLAEDLVEQLEKHASEISKALKKHEAKAFIGFQVSTEMGVKDSEFVREYSFGFSPRVIRFISDLGGTIECDFDMSCSSNEI